MSERALHCSTGKAKESSVNVLVCAALGPPELATKNHTLSNIRRELTTLGESTYEMLCHRAAIHNDKADQNEARVCV